MHSPTPNSEEAYFAYDHEYDNALRYRRAPNYASGGLAAWENMQSLTSHLDGVDVMTTTIAASLTAGGMQFASELRGHGPGGDYDGFGTLHSENAGDDWSVMVEHDSPWAFVGDIVYQEQTSRWLLGLDEGASWGYRWASAGAPANWSALQVFSDAYYSSGEPELALDASHDGRVALLGGRALTDDLYEFLFDAEWRADPGYPNYEDGFPVALTAEPVSDPAVVDLDGDGDLEVVFGDAAGRIQAYRCNGTPLPGWPVTVGTTLSASPVAVGDIDADGEPEVVAGAADGRVFAYGAGGAPAPGWPIAMPAAAPAYVAVGALGGPHARGVVVAAGPWVQCFAGDGDPYPGAYLRSLGERTIAAAPAIGDVDGDEQNEIVVAGGDVVAAFPVDVVYWNLFEELEAEVSGGVALADFDLDGDVEVVAPLASGVMHLLAGDGSEVGAPWPVTVGGGALNGVAIAQCVGTAPPEIAVSSRDWQVTLYQPSGSVPGYWPVDTDGWRIYGKPIIGRVEGTSTDVIVGARGSRGWAWDNLGHLIPGWPKALPGHVYRTPAYGDLDLDGRAEVVLLGAGSLGVVDVVTAPHDASRTWAMAGHDPARSGCADCADVLVPVPESSGGVTRVSLAAPWPNPIAGAATFAYAIPIRARVELAIHDLRGRRVATVTRAESPAGRHEIAWLARDDGGRPVASGSYLATLRVQGPGVDETLTRKVTVVR